MIKSEVVKKDGKIADVQVSIKGTPTELYGELKGILESFDDRHEMGLILVQVISELVNNMEGK